MNTSIEYVTMPAALRVASSISVITLLRGSLGSSSTVAVPRSFSYWPTLPKLKPPKAADWPGNILGACERAGSQVTLVMRASAMSGATAKAAVIASAIVLMNDLLYLPKPLPGLPVTWHALSGRTVSRHRGRVGLVDEERRILGKQQAPADEAVCRCGDLGDVVGVRRIALLQRGARVVRRLALGERAEERNDRAGQVAGIAFAEARFPHVPAQIRRERHQHIGIGQPGDGVAVRVHLGHAHRVGAALHRRLAHHARDVLDVEERPAIEIELLRGDAGQREVHGGDLRGGGGGSPDQPPPNPRPEKRPGGGPFRGG